MSNRGRASIMSDGSNPPSRRSRSLKRTFILLRFCDQLMVPRENVYRALQSSGRVKEMEFFNNSATSSIHEMIRNTFRDHLNRDELASLKFYRTVSGTRTLTYAGAWQDMCGDTLKNIYKNRPKIFLRLSQDMTNRSSGGTRVINTAGTPAALSGNTSATDPEEIVEIIPPRLDVNSITINSNDDDDPIPIFTSSPIVPSSGASALQEAEGFVAKLYDQVNCSAGAVNKDGQTLAAKATEVGTLVEVANKLIGAEANPRSGHAYDLQVLRKLMYGNKIPQVLQFLCMDAQEMKKQCHADFTPLVLIRYTPHQSAMAALRYLLSVAQLLNGCYIQVTLQGSIFDDRVCGEHQMSATTSIDDLEVRVLHPTLTSSKMVLGTIVAGSDKDFVNEITKALEQAQEACHGLKAHRELIEQERRLKEQQEIDFLASEAADREKARTRSNQENRGDMQNVDSNEDAQEVNNALDETVVDTAEIRRKRIESLEGMQANKRRRTSSAGDIDDNDDNGDNDESRIVVFKDQQTSSGS